MLVTLQGSTVAPAIAIAAPGIDAIPEKGKDEIGKHVAGEGKHPELNAPTPDKG